MRATRCTGSRRHSAARLAGLVLALAGLLVACSGGGAVPQPSGPGSDPTSPAPFAGATSQSCADTRGAEALYWDYMNGLIRVDYPQTTKFLPFAPAGFFIHRVQPLYNFGYPPGYRVLELTDPQRQLTGATVIRGDDRVVWRRLNYTVVGATTATDQLATETGRMLDNLGVTSSDEVEVVCNLVAPDGSRHSTIVRAGGFTANVSVQVPLRGGINVVFAQVALAPTEEYDAAAVNVFFPLTGQLTPDGSSADEPDCRDGKDNDGDGATDYPADAGCTSADDESEAGP